MKRGAALLGLLLLISVIIFTNNSNIGAFTLCTDVKSPTNPCPEGEKRLAQVDSTGCVLRFMCVDPATIAGGASRFGTCSNVPLPKYLLCMDPYPIPEKVYRHTDLCQIGEICLGAEHAPKYHCPPIPTSVSCPKPDDVPVLVMGIDNCQKYECQTMTHQNYPFPQNLPPIGSKPPYKWTTSTISGIMPQRVTHATIPSTPSYQPPPTYTIPVTGQPTPTPTIPMPQQQPVYQIPVTGVPAPTPTIPAPATEPIPQIAVTPPKPSAINVKANFIIQQLYSQYITKIPTTLEVVKLPEYLGT